jgi:hypothetical protein
MRTSEYVQVDTAMNAIKSFGDLMALRDVLLRRTCKPTPHSSTSTPQSIAITTGERVAQVERLVAEHDAIRHRRDWATFDRHEALGVTVNKDGTTAWELKR